MFNICKNCLTLEDINHHYFEKVSMRGKEIKKKKRKSVYDCSIGLITNHNTANGVILIIMCVKLIFMNQIYM